MSALATAPSTTITPDLWEPLVDVLREELQEYGGFLVLLQDQQKAILDQDADAMRRVEGEIERQIMANQKLRHARVRMVAEVAVRLGAATDSSLKDLLHGFPPAARPMVEALINEINALITKARNGIKQNQLLLARVSSVTEKILTAINPRPSTKVYTKNGAIAYKAISIGSYMHTSA